MTVQNKYWLAILILVNISLVGIIKEIHITSYASNVTLRKSDKDRYSTKNDSLSINHITLKVLLVEFSDVKHRSPDYPSNLSLPSYSFNDIENLLFSENKYFSPNMFSPDSKKVYGSLRDYYRIMSNGKLIIDGYILNQDADTNNVPDWIALNNSKKYYDSNRVDQFRYDSKSIAGSRGIDVSTDENTFLVIIYAGHTYRDYNNKTLVPHAFNKEYEYIMGERFASGFPYSKERDDPNFYPISHFSHIGIHAHEFGHLLGFNDHFGGYDNEYWCLMSKGGLNGPEREGACPAPLNPYLRSMKNWIEFDSLHNFARKNIYYSLEDPTIYKLQDNCSNSFFLVEFRKFNGDQQLGNQVCKDYNSFIQNVTLENGILVWRKLKGNFVKLLYSCGYYSQDGDQHIFPGFNHSKVLTPWSDNRSCKAGLYWVPNTKPSTNCGLEIISTDQEYYTIDLYQESPYLASPSKPCNVKSISDNNVVLTWDKNFEPDFFYYKVYKSEDNLTYTVYDTTKINLYRDSLEFIDSQSVSNNFVYYKICSIDSTNKESTLSTEIKVAVKTNVSAQNLTEIFRRNKLNLAQNYPNPFNPTTIIKYSIPEPSSVTLKVFDLRGSEMATLVNTEQSEGNYKIEFDGSDLTSGIYFYKLQSGDFVETKKMILLR